MSKLLYIPTGKICTFHQENSSKRTTIIEDSLIFEELGTIQRILTTILSSATNTFKIKNEINENAIIEEFEIINE